MGEGGVTVSRYSELIHAMLRDASKALSEEMGDLLRGLVDEEALREALQGFLLRYSYSVGPQSMGASASGVAYAILGLDPSASDGEVRQRYRELAKRLHPDVSRAETAHLFRLVQAAYEQISRERGWKA